MLESKIQSKCIKAMQKDGWFVLKIIRCNLPGFNDTIALKAARTVIIEFKRPGETPDPLQVFRHEQLRAQGFEVYTVDSWEAYLELKL